MIKLKKQQQPVERRNRNKANRPASGSPTVSVDGEFSGYHPHGEPSTLDTDPGATPSVFMARALRDWSMFEKRYVAVQSSAYVGGINEEKTRRSMGYWYDVLGYAESVTPEFAKAGGRIVHAIGLRTPEETLKRLLGLEHIDEDTASAANAALFMAFNTNPAPVDLDAVVLGIATFIYSHPHLRRMGDEAPFVPPFGDDTAWIPVSFGQPEKD